MPIKTTTVADENVSTVVRMLLAAKRGTPDALATELGISRSTVFEKLNGNRRWYAAEVQGLAHYFDLDVNAFYAGPDGMLRQSTKSDNQINQPALFDYALAS